MLESPTFRKLILSARRVLDRLEIELAHHGGMDDGRLPVTYDDCQRYGIDRHAITPAIRELVGTEHGRAGNAEWRKPNQFRITYKHTRETSPTHEWKEIEMSEGYIPASKTGNIWTASRSALREHFSGSRRAAQ